MEFVPEKNNIGKIIAAGIILFDVLLLLLFFSQDSTRIKAMLLFLLLLSNVYGIYILVLIHTLKYRLDHREFIIAGAFELKKIRIPIQDIESWSRKITLLDTVGIGFATARFALGKGLDNNGEQADLFITSSKKVIYLRTSQGNFGISPKNADEFTRQLKDMGIPQQTGNERHYIRRDENKGRGLLNQLTLYGIILTAVLLTIPLVTHYLDLIPDLLQISANRWVSEKAYLESVFTKGLVALLLILISYGMIMLLSSIEGRYYYRMMYFPLTVIVILLFMEINTQLTALLA